MKEKRHSFRNHLGLALFISLLIVAITAGYLHHFADPVYQATATMSGNNSHANIVKSNTNIDSALKKLGVDEVNGMVFVRTLNKANLIKVTVVSQDSAFATDYANALAASCRDYVVETSQSSKLEAVAVAEKEVADNDAALVAAREALAKEGDLEQLKAKIATLSPMVAELENQLALIDMSAANDKANIPSYFLVTAPKEEYIKDALDEYKTILKESVVYEANGSFDRSVFMNETLANLATGIENECYEMTGTNDIAKPLADYLVVLARYEVLTNLVETYSAEISKAKESVANIEKLSMQVSLGESAAYNLVQSLSDAKAIKIDIPVSIVDPALSKKSWLYNVAFCLLSFIIGLVFAAFICAGIDRRERGINSEAQVRNIVGEDVPSLGWLPYTKKFEVNASGYASERYKLLTSNISLLAGDKDLKVLTVCSTECGEGKSTTTLNVAKELAHLNKKVIIVDANLRRPDMETYFSLAHSQYGLSDIVLNRAVKEQAIVRPIDDLSNLNLIGAGAKVDNPSLILDSPNFKKLVRSLRDDYDYVFVDCPALSFGSDFMLISRVLDAYILNVRANVAAPRSLYDFNEQRKLIALPLLGFIFYGRKEKNLDRKEPDVRKPNARILAQAPLVHQQIRVNPQPQPQVKPQPKEEPVEEVGKEEEK